MENEKEISMTSERETALTSDSENNTVEPVFAPAATYVQMPEEQPKKKKKTKLIVICAIIAVLVAGFAVGGFFIIKEVGVQNKISEVSAVADSFESGETGYSGALQMLEKYEKESDQRIIDAVRKTKTELNNLKAPTEAYYEGLKYAGDGAYYQAVTALLKVTSESKNYDAATEKISELKESLKSEVETTADKYIKDKDYDRAISAYEFYDKTYSGNTFSEKIAVTKEERAKYLAEKKAEEERLKAEREKQELENARAKLRISRCWVSGPDSAGGYELHINWTNKSDKIVKYFVFGVTFIDPVGEAISTWRIDKVVYCQDVGPFNPGGGRSGSGWYWGKYYDSIIDHPKIVSVQVEYMDGTVWTLTSKEIDAVQY